MSSTSAQLKALANQDVVASRTQRRVIGVVLAVVATALSAYVSVPVPWSPVPMTLQPMVVLLIGLLMGPTLGLASMVTYLGVGMAGLPVFAAGGAGAPWLLGPTGGYLMAFPVTAWTVGRIAGGPGASTLRVLGALVSGLAVLYAGGVTQLLVLTGQDLGTAVSLGMAPFVLGDLLKVGVAAAVGGKVRDRSLQLF